MRIDLSDWRSIAAFGLTICGIILCVKVDSDGAEKVLVNLTDAFDHSAVVEDNC